MAQDKSFAGQPVFAQVLSLVDRGLFQRLVAKHNANRYAKRCGAWEHFVAQCYCVLANCTSLREVTQGLAAYGDKLNHLGMTYSPPRSTLSDASARRSHTFFADLYQRIYRQHQPLLSDSPRHQRCGPNHPPHTSHAGIDTSRVHLIDSTTIGLFKAIMKTVGAKRLDGRCKGGVKVHTLINAYEQVPQLVHITPAAASDQRFLAHIKLERHQIAVFDKGYVNYEQYARFSHEQVHFVSRLKNGAVYQRGTETLIEDHLDSGYIKDQQITVYYNDPHNGKQPLVLRRVVYYDADRDKTLEFVTNITAEQMNAEQIGLLYKLRWQIELLFKQLKQNFPLKYFLGDNENAILIQIWCTLIVNLLLTLIRRHLKHKTIAFSVLVSFLRQHLFNYQRLNYLIEQPERFWRKLLNAAGDHSPGLQQQFCFTYNEEPMGAEGGLD